MATSESIGFSAVGLSILVRWLVGRFPHSGQDVPPLYGDYEAQRHWMEITTNLPPDEWYRNSTYNDLSYWGKIYQVTIKSANQKTDDYVANCESEWTVYKLKQHIAITHVNKPPVESQRLIYSGRVLNDNHILRQIFFRDSLCTDQNPDKSDFTIHIVCAQGQQASSVSAPSQSNNRPVAAPPSSQSTPNQSQFVQHQNPANQQPDLFLNNLVRSISQQQQQINRNNLVNPTSSATANNANAATPSISPNSPTITAPNISSNLTGFNIFSGSGSGARVVNVPINPYVNNVLYGRNVTLDPQAQQALFQQMTRLVASQINHLSIAGASSTGNIPNIDLSSQATTLPTGPHTIASILAHHSAGPQLNVNFYQNLGRNATNPQPDVNNNLNNNGVNMHVDQDQRVRFRDDVPNMDQAQPMQQNNNLDAQRNGHVIDWFFYTIRALILMTAIYVHSAYKFLFVAGFLIFYYFFTRPNRQMRRRQMRQMRAAQRLQQMRHQNDNNIDDNDNVRNGPGHPENMPQNSVQGQQEARLPFLKMIYMVVSSFIISLIPENHV